MGFNGYNTQIPDSWWYCDFSHSRQSFFHLKLYSFVKKKILEKNNFNKFINDIEFGGDCFQPSFTSAKSKIIWKISYLYTTANRHVGKKKICLSSIRIRKDWAQFITRTLNFWVLEAIHQLHSHPSSLFTLKRVKSILGYCSSKSTPRFTLL